MISIIIPFFNSKLTLERAVNSVIKQSFKNWELILVDDGSQDRSVDNISRFLGYSNIKLIQQNNSGVSKSRNSGALQALGDWLLFLDSDDELERDGLLSFTNFIQKNPYLSLIRGGFKRIYNETVEVRIPTEEKDQSFLSGTFLIKKSVFFEELGYDERIKFSENSELLHRLQIKQVPVGYLGKVVLKYYESKGGGSKNLQNMMDSLIIILDKHKATLSPHVLHLYHQILGVIYIRFRRFTDARFHLWKAIRYKPQKLVTWGRFGLACFPFLAKRLYSQTVKYD